MQTADGWILLLPYLRLLVSEDGSNFNYIQQFWKKYDQRYEDFPASTTTGTNTNTSF